MPVPPAALSDWAWPVPHVVCTQMSPDTVVSLPLHSTLSIFTPTPASQGSESFWPIPHLEC